MPFVAPSEETTNTKRKSTNLREMPSIPPVDPLAWRAPRSNEELEDLHLSTGRIPGAQRCRAIGLGHKHSACSQSRWPGSVYCNYHDRMQQGLLEPEVESYPVFPLPRTGYVISYPVTEVLGRYVVRAEAANRRAA